MKKIREYVSRGLKHTNIKNHAFNTLQAADGSQMELYVAERLSWPLPVRQL
jgi:hypothetical protein